MGDSVDSVSDEEKRAMREVNHVVEMYGIKNLEGYFKSKLEGWRDVEVNFGITGDSGTGKSSFINSIRGLCDDAERAAEVGVTETTTVPTRYDHPTNPKIKFWDLPGMGTPNHPDMMTYSSELSFMKYDVFLIFTASRFTKNDLRLAEEIRKIHKKKFFFIRTKVDVDVLAEKKKRSPLNEDAMLEKIRRDILKSLGDLLSNEEDIFLLSNHYPDKWDFDRLTQAILDALPAAQQESIILSLGNVTRSIFTSKVKVLKSRLWIAASLSGVVAAAPVPGLSFAVDAGLILHEFKFYRNQLGLPEVGSTHFARLDSSSKKAVLSVCLTTVGQVIKYMSLYTAGAATEEVAHFIPFLGSVIAGTMSFSVTYLVLDRYLKQVEKVAELILKDTAQKSVEGID